MRIYKTRSAYYVLADKEKKMRMWSEWNGVAVASKQCDSFVYLCKQIVSEKENKIKYNRVINKSKKQSS